MTDDPKSLVEAGKAIQEISKATGKAIDLAEKFGGFISRFVAGPLEQRVGIFFYRSGQAAPSPPLAAAVELHRRGDQTVSVLEHGLGRTSVTHLGPHVEIPGAGVRGVQRHPGNDRARRERRHFV